MLKSLVNQVFQRFFILRKLRKRPTKDHNI
nr:MAG TPA: hypothetical protein [Caudoviricetes sp.]